MAASSAPWPAILRGAGGFAFTLVFGLRARGGDFALTRRGQQRRNRGSLGGGVGSSSLTVAASAGLAPPARPPPGLAADAAVSLTADLATGVAVSAGFFSPSRKSSMPPWGPGASGSGGRCAGPVMATVFAKAAAGRAAPRPRDRSIVRCSQLGFAASGASNSPRHAAIDCGRPSIGSASALSIAFRKRGR